jgi:hypothetical protein
MLRLIEYYFSGKLEAELGNAVDAAAVEVQSSCCGLILTFYASV